MARIDIPGIRLDWSVIRGYLNTMFTEVYSLISGKQDKGLQNQTFDPLNITLTKSPTSFLDYTQSGVLVIALPSTTYGAQTDFQVNLITDGSAITLPSEAAIIVNEYDNTVGYFTLVGSFNSVWQFFLIKLNVAIPNQQPVQLVMGTVTASQYNATTGRFTWSNVSGNAGYSYRYKIDSGSYRSYNDLAQDVATVDITATAGQRIYIEVIAKGNGTTTLDSNPSAEVSVLLSVNQAPVASAVSITGSTILGATLTGHYTYTDNESNAEGTSTFRWLRDDVAISGATGLTHVIVLADQGHTIKFEITPVASVGTSPGTPVASSGTSIPANAAPVYSGATITGTATEGQTLTAVKGTYSDADGDAEGTPTYQWLICATVGGTYTNISGATNSTYVIQSGDVGKYIKVDITPTATTGTSPGLAVRSVATNQIQTAAIAETDITWKTGYETFYTQVNSSELAKNNDLAGSAVSQVDYLTGDGYVKFRLPILTPINTGFYLGLNYRSFTDDATVSYSLGYFGGSSALIVQESGSNSHLGGTNAASGMYFKVERSGTVVKYYTSTDDVTYTLYYTSLISSTGNLYAHIYSSTGVNTYHIDHIKIKKGAI